MAKIACTCCQKPLKNGVDTFGDVDAPMCGDCYWAEQVSGQSIYGLAPHHHVFSEDGSVGATILDPLPEPNENGEYDLGYATFWPDPDAPGLGVWTYK